MENLIKNNSFFNTLYRVLGSFIIRVFGLFIKVKENRILFSSGMGNFIGDSPLVLYGELKDDPKFSNYEMIWAVKDLEKCKGDYNLVRINTVKYFFYALSSKIWITSVNIERGLKFKKKETVYLNTWHGVPLKHIGLDVKARKDYDFSHVDIFITSGDYENSIYKQAFKLSEEQLFTTGLPRNITLEKSTKNKKSLSNDEILNKIGLANIEEKKIILFAPTWKDYDYDKLDLSKLCDELGDSYIILFKSHPLELWQDLDPRVIDVSNNHDIISLMKISDILISDYSSIMIDYSILERPIFAYVPDYDTYKSSRGLYVTREELAPNIVTNERDLIHNIIGLDFELESRKTMEYKKKYLSVNAISSIDKITKVLKDKLDGNEERKHG